MKLTYRLFFISIIFFSIPSFGDYWLRSDNARDQVKMEEGLVCYVVDEDDNDVFFGTVNSEKHCAGDWYKSDQSVEPVVFSGKFSFQPRDYEKLEHLKNEMAKKKTGPMNEIEFLRLTDGDHLDRKYGEVWDEIQKSENVNYKITITGDDQDLTIEVDQVVKTRHQGGHRKVAYEVVFVKYERQVEEVSSQADASNDEDTGEDFQGAPGYVYRLLKKRGDVANEKGERIAVSQLNKDDSVRGQFRQLFNDQKKFQKAALEAYSGSKFISVKNDKRRAQKGPGYLEAGFNGAECHKIFRLHKKPN